MSNSRSDLSTSPLPEEEGEESKPLLTGKSESVLIAPANPASARSPARGTAQKSSLAKSNLHRSVDNQLDGASTEPKPHKQILFRTGSHQTTPLSVHYNNGKTDSSEQNNNTSAKEESPKDSNGHRFQVAKVNSTNDDSSDDRDDDSEADNDSLRANIYATAGYDTRNLKSFKHYTREALPRVDNYRNISSIHGHAERPTLDELHGVQTTVQFDSKSKTITPTVELLDPNAKQTKFGWIEGVLVRCLLNIWGVILFIRLSWVAAQAGILYGTITLLLASVCTIVTTLSMSAICTNGEVKGGGTYYMISRSLGPEFGGAIGIIFSLANAVAVAMYTVGFSETVRDMMWLFWGYQIFDGGMNDVRLISCITAVILLGIVFVGTEWESKTQMVLLVILVAAMLNFMIGSCIPPSPEKISKGFIGWSTSLFMENLKPAYRDGHDFISIFSIYFPAATGILAGANISGDLKNPSVAIPKGTLLAIIITTITYVGFLVVIDFNVMRDANGVIELVANQTITPEVIAKISRCDLAPNGKCMYGTMNFFQIIEMMSWFGPLIYAGIYAATLSSALASLVSAPKVFQALCQDKLLPGIEFFGKGYGINNEPKRGYMLTFIIAFACCLIGELNAIAPIISNFFLAAYTLINFACFHSSFVKSPGFRPAFKWFSAWTSLAGSVFSLVVMFIMSWTTALITFILLLAIYVWIMQRKPEVNWGSSTQAQNYKSAIQSVYRLNLIPEHVKTYRPQILLLSGNPGTHSSFVDLAYTITKGTGMLICGNIITSPISNRAQNVILQDSNLWLVKRDVKAFVNLVQESNFFLGVRAMIQASGIGKLKPNIVMLGFKNDWTNVEQNELLDYFKTIHLIFDKHLSLVIVSIPENIAEIAAITANGQSSGNSSVSVNIHSKESGIGSDGNISDIANDFSYFAIKQKKGYIDVWWLYDDGGLTLLLPYLISANTLWKDCKMRVFALVNRKSELDTEQRNMAALLSKFRIDFSDVIIITDIMKPPSENTRADFESLIAKYVVDDESNASPSSDYDKLYVTESELLAFKDKNYRHMRLRELLLENSKDARLVVMTLPMPRKNQCPAVLYMAWLDLLTKGMPPMMMMRGNQTNVLTFYS